MGLHWAHAPGGRWEEAHTDESCQFEVVASSASSRPLECRVVRPARAIMREVYACATPRHVPPCASARCGGAQMRVWRDSPPLRITQRGGRSSRTACAVVAPPSVMRGSGGSLACPIHPPSDLLSGNVCT